MSRKVQLVVTVEREQQEQLRALSKRTHVSQSTFVRRALEQLFAAIDSETVVTGEYSEAIGQWDEGHPTGEVRNG